MSYHQELNTAVRAAKEAAGVIKSYAEKGFDINLKGKNDLVTEADLAAEERIISVIKKEFPGDEFLAEESTGRKALSEQRTWIIDPIDGTTNFAHNFPIYCVSIALWENGEAKAGVVYQVPGDELFTAVKGHGAFLNDSKMRVSGQDDPSASLIVTGFPYKSLELVVNYLEVFRVFMEKTHGVRRPGSAAYDLCCVAAGRFEGFYEYGLSPWDVAAGSLIIQEAGGVITDWTGGDDWFFGERIIAGNTAVHGFIKKEIQRVFEAGQLTL